MDSFQTPDVEHLDNWMEIVSSLTGYFGSQRRSAGKVHKWQKYDKRYKSALNMVCQYPLRVQRQMESIILSFEQEPFLPKLQIKAEGAKKETFRTKRTP